MARAVPLTMGGTATQDVTDLMEQLVIEESNNQRKIDKVCQTRAVRFLSSIVQIVPFCSGC